MTCEQIIKFPSRFCKQEEKYLYAEIHYHLNLIEKAVKECEISAMLVSRYSEELAKLTGQNFVKTREGHNV